MKKVMGLVGVYLHIFIVLKLTGLVTWSWPITLIPLWVILVEATLRTIYDMEGKKGKKEKSK